MAAWLWLRAEAETQQRSAVLEEAEAQRRIAERRFDDVRELANTFLFDFHDAIDDLPGSTPARKLIVESALTYLRRLEQDASNDSGLQNDLMVGHVRVGDVQVTLGDTARALASYRASLAIAERLAQADPSNARVQRDLAISHALVGEVLRATGDLDGARESYERARPIFERLAELDGANTQAQDDLAATRQRLEAVGASPAP